jgi:hypothetical protein
MKRLLIVLLALLLSFAAGTLTPALFAAPAPVSYLPIVQRAVESSICNPSAPLLDQDTGWLSAILDASGRYVLAYQDRAHGSRAHIAQHVGDHLIELAAPALVTADQTSPAPAFSPDGPKQGSLALVPGAPGQKNRLYYTQRKPDDTTGPYGIWCLEFP